mgnify:CR=1 FL=1
MKTNIAVFFGGNSVEHEVSIISGIQAIQNIDKERYTVTPVYIAKDKKMYIGKLLDNIENFKNIGNVIKNSCPVFITNENGRCVLKPENSSFLKKNKPIAIDVALPVVHGTNCEDGSLQGLFEVVGLPYVGCDVLASAVGMDKAVFKSVLKAANIPVLDCVVFSSREFSENMDLTVQKLESQIGYPLIIKPANLGSSVGISKVENKNELIDAISYAAEFTNKILAERAINNLREINCSCVGYLDEFEASCAEEPIMHDKILSYKDKYLSGDKNGKSGSKGMTSLSRKLPADLDAYTQKEIERLTVETFKAINGHGVARIDFLMDAENNEIFVNEINTIPGSLAFYLWEAKGIKYKELLTRLINLAFKRKREKENFTFSINTGILNGNFNSIKK